MFRIFSSKARFKILKSMQSQLSLEQKIKVIAVLDKLLAVFKIFSLYIVENRDFQLYHVKIWKIDVSLQISNRTKFWSKIVTTLIFFSSESWDSILFKNWKGDPKGGPGKELFWLKISIFFSNFRFWRHASEQNTFFPGPPFGPPFLFLESMESQLSLEKN